MFIVRRDGFQDATLEANTGPGQPGTLHARLKEIERDDSEMIRIPAGEFLMGSIYGDADEKPQRRVYLDEYWIEINRLENSADKTYRRTLTKLFGGEYEALEVLKLKDIVDSLEAAVDAFESVANTVEQIAVKES